MARGWESKSIESQMEDRHAARELRDSRSPEEREMSRRRDSIELSLRRILNELQTARSEAHRSSLEHARAHLDAELAKLDAGSGNGDQPRRRTTS